MERVPVPTRLYLQDGQAMLQTVRLPASVYEAPFLSDGLRQGLSEGDAARSAVSCPVKDLPEEGALPAGLIFHVSRCGSTLVTQMLGTLPGVRGVSEPEALSLYLLHCAQGACAFDAEAFRRLIKAFGRGAGPGGRYVIKFSSWNVLFLDRILDALPGVPWVFLTRDATEVMASNFRNPSAPLRWYRSREPWFKTCFPDWPGEEPDAPEAFFAGCLARYARKAREHEGPRCLWVDYARLPGMVHSHLLAHFGLQVDAAQRARMEEKGRYRAKGNTRQPFVPDGEAKRAEATEAIREAVKRWLTPPAGPAPESDRADSG
ncbi:hypothetical protein [Corallococcus exercitus]|uniref:Sulfotransferase family protein n=1 Tax=Corallococcus exercitus TaxID=2316736 RepID=A0A7Y4NGA6_9BACT|nr:hypothetical protein [Corallococcus exercitus]NOK13197.1 hypothetical protein [Corallococcus exercitus]